MRHGLDRVEAQIPDDLPELVGVGQDMHVGGGFGDLPGCVGVTFPAWVHGKRLYQRPDSQGRNSKDLGLAKSGTGR